MLGRREGDETREIAGTSTSEWFLVRIRTLWLQIFTVNDNEPSPSGDAVYTRNLLHTQLYTLTPYSEAKLHIRQVSVTVNTIATRFLEETQRHVLRTPESIGSLCPAS